MQARGTSLEAGGTCTCTGPGLLAGGRGLRGGTGPSRREGASSPRGTYPRGEGVTKPGAFLAGGLLEAGACRRGDSNIDVARSRGARSERAW